MGTIKQGAVYAVHKYLRIKPGNKVVIVSDNPSERYARSVFDEAKRVSDDVHGFLLEDYKTERFPRAIMKHYDKEGKKVVSFHFCTDNLPERYLDRHPLLRLGDSIADLLDKEHPDYIKHVSLPGINKKIMQQGLCVPVNILKYYGALIYRRLNGAKNIHITSKAGTDLEVKVNSKNIPWIKEDHIDFGWWENLPLGEVYTSPVDANGIFVVDFMIGEGYEEKYDTGFLRRNPITLNIENGRVNEICCRRGTKLVDLLEEEFFFGHGAANAVGEIGFGCNFGLKKLIGNMLQDEKYPGVHIGIGGSDPDCGKKWRSNTHIDVMTFEPSVLVDDKLLIFDGKYVFNDSKH